MFKKIITLFFIGVAFSCSLNAEILFKNELINKKIQNIADEKIRSNKTAGMVVLVQHGDNTEYLNAFGYSYLKDKGRNIKYPVEMKTDTIFDLASLSKVLATTQAIMMLQHENKLQLDDKVSKYLTEFNTPDKENITIYDLLTHSSGLSAWKPLYIHAKNKHEVLAYIGKLPLAYKTGTNQIYSDLGFITLGAIVESASGESLDTYLQENLYKKLGMNDTGYNPSSDKKSRIAATSWENLFEQNMLKDGKYGVVEKPEDFKNWRKYTLQGEADDGNAFYAMQGVSGHAGLFSTAQDVSKLMQVMLNGGTLNGVEFYSADILNTFSQKQDKADFKGRAIGFDYSRDYMGKNRFPNTFGHIGFTGGCLALNKEQKLGIVILTNRENVGLNANGEYTGFNDLCSEIMDTVYENYKS
ncbi:MAG: serine hydrolase [Alphaproteobacteria bacterium]|jgi:CubicO group peptidase (beta-lactamase class C family)|nr:serine hydrolase [Alphaproteobacteria bacterium]